MDFSSFLFYEMRKHTFINIISFINPICYSIALIIFYNNAVIYTGKQKTSLSFLKSFV